MAITRELFKCKFSAVLSLVKATKYVKFRSTRCTGFKVGIFQISPINHCMDMNSLNQDGPLLYVASASCLPDQDFRDKDQPVQTA